MATLSLNRLLTTCADDLKALEQHLVAMSHHSIPLIQQLMQHLIQSGGKRFRGLLTIAFSKLAKAPYAESILLAACVESLHQATLLHDDVIDQSEERRGTITAPFKFGNKASILVGDFLLSQAFELMVKTQNIDVFAVISNAASALIEGEVQQFCYSRALDLSVERYLDILKGKTAPLFAAACEVAGVISQDEHRQKFAKFGYYLGISYQLIDDLLDYISDSSVLGKPQGQDFYEGKTTFPIIWSYTHCGPALQKEWARCWENPTRSSEDFRWAIDVLESTGAFQETRRIAAEYAKQAAVCLMDYPDSALKADLMALPLDLVNRDF